MHKQNFSKLWPQLRDTASDLPPFLGSILFPTYCADQQGKMQFELSHVLPILAHLTFLFHLLIQSRSQEKLPRPTHWLKQDGFPIWLCIFLSSFQFFWFDAILYKEIIKKIDIYSLREFMILIHREMCFLNCQMRMGESNTMYNSKNFLDKFDQTLKNFNQQF